MDVFFFEAFEEEEQALREYLPSHITAGFSWKTVQEYAADTPPAPIISVRTQSQIPLGWATELGAILSRSTGFDHLITYRKATGMNVPSGYLPLYCHRAVAEQATMMWLCLQRKFFRQCEQFRTFQRDGLTGSESEGKNLLVVGTGNIGGEVAKIGTGLGMNVACVDLVEKHTGYRYVSISEGLPWADIVVCAMDLREENAGYFSEALLRTTRPGTLFVNVSRGELSPSAALLRLVEEGHLGGVALDAYDQEKELGVALRAAEGPVGKNVEITLRLSEHPNVICTPHNAFNTHEGVQRKSEQSIEQIVHFLNAGHFIWPA